MHYRTNSPFLAPRSPRAPLTCTGQETMEFIIRMTILVSLSCRLNIDIFILINCEIVVVIAIYKTPKFGDFGAF